jgi:hypothetical protein
MLAGQRCEPHPLSAAGDGRHNLWLCRRSNAESVQTETHSNHHARSGTTPRIGFVRSQAHGGGELRALPAASRRYPFPLPSPQRGGLPLGHDPVAVETYLMLASSSSSSSSVGRCSGGLPITGIRLLVSPVWPL